MHELATSPIIAGPKWDDSVSVVISTKDGGYLLDGLVHQLLSISRVAEILIVSNNTSGDYTLGLLDRLSNTERCRVFRYDRPFNFSVQTNHAVREAKGKFLLILNDDVSLIGSDWLDTLLVDVDCEQPRIAGPLMLYGNQSIQQGGMYLGHNHRAGHTFRHQRHPHDAPMFELVAPRLVSCLTGACLLMKRSLYEDLNGFDEQLATGLQDVDLCLRALYSGAELVFDPRAIIFHLESVSLIPTLSDESVQRRRDREYARFRDRWDSELRPDRWHNQNFYIEDEALRQLRIAD
jgi:GT2 family glycosyltransferase